MLRNALALLAGLAVGMTLNMAIIQLNTQVLFPMPTGTDTSDPEAFNAYLATLPALAFIVTIAAHLAQSFFGALVAARLATSHRGALAMAVGLLSLAGGVAAFAMFDGPTWMAIEFPLYLVTAWLAGRWATPQATTPAGPSPEAASSER